MEKESLELLLGLGLTIDQIAQRTGKAPHSPKNCLPGAGWVQEQSGMVDVAIAGEPAPIRLNRYVVSRGQNQSAVLYWYQARNRTIASEYESALS